MIADAYASLFDAPVVGFAGDWHGNTQWSQFALRALADKGVKVVYQVGDFGLWGGDDGAKYLLKVQKALDENDMLLVVVPGNHENYDMLEKMPVLDDGWICRVTREPRIVYAPRGHLWTHQHVRFAALGGAASIDRALRTPGTSWWAQEAITTADVERLRENVSGKGWDMVDVLLTHESPAGVRIPASTPAFATPEIIHDCWQQRVLIRDAVDSVTPGWLVHGHWHRVIRDSVEGVSIPDDRPFTTRVIGLNMEGPGNVATATLTPIVGLTELTLRI